MVNDNVRHNKNKQMEKNFGFEAVIKFAEI